MIISNLMVILKVISQLGEHNKNTKKTHNIFKKNYFDVVRICLDSA
jgi:hypothetical protein